MDRSVLVSLTLDHEGVRLRLVNDTGRVVTIVWERCRFIDSDGRSHPVLGSLDPGTCPTNVPPGQMTAATLVALERGRRVLDHLPVAAGRASTAVHLVLADDEGRVVRIHATIGARWDSGLRAYRVDTPLVRRTFDESAIRAGCAAPSRSVSG